MRSQATEEDEIRRMLRGLVMTLMPKESRAPRSTTNGMALTLDLTIDLVWEGTALDLIRIAQPHISPLCVDAPRETQRL